MGPTISFSTMISSAMCLISVEALLQIVLDLPVVEVLLYRARFPIEDPYYVFPVRPRRFALEYHIPDRREFIYVRRERFCLLFDQYVPHVLQVRHYLFDAAHILLVVLDKDLYELRLPAGPERVMLLV